MDMRAAQALVRFGLGRRGAEPVPADPQAWLAAQLRGPDPAVAGSGTADGLRALAAARDLRRARDGAAPAPPGTMPANGATLGHPAPGPGGDEPEPHPVRDLYRADAQDLLATAIATDAPFRERLVWFWANHFTVSLRQAQCAALAGAFVREAIRPHVTGRFADMLLAVLRHPAMLIYLDNAGSVGPNSRAGLRTGRGLNENLARECLELHTLSPAGGYTQADVTEFARVLTGWGVERREEPLGFRFRPQQHEPGGRTLLGRALPDGEAGGVEAVAFLATHPATHRHLARRMVMHFVADEPAPDDVARIAGVLRDTDGDLAAAALAVTRLPAAWVPGTKLRAPQDYVVACLRALDLPEARRPDPVRSALALGQPVWGAPFPIGWPDQAEGWSGPEAVLRRVDWAYSLAGRAGGTDPQAVAEASLGPLLHPATLEAMRQAGSRRDALTLLLAGPEFQRR